MKTKMAFATAMVVAGFLTLHVASAPAADAASEDRVASLRGSFGTYAGQPRGKERRVDVERLVAELVEMRVNTYHWLIWTEATDWDDLKRFLPLARQHGILVWACLVPPSESPPQTKNYSEPFKLDYERWVVEIAKLSRAEPNLVAWSVDDFSHNLKVFTPERLGAILGEARKINPRLAFVPCIYFPKAAQASVAKDYQGLLDGILFPYRHESNKANLTDASLVEEEVGKIKAAWGATFPVIVDVYSTAHSRLGASTPDYVRQVMSAGIRCADGVHIYTHPQPGSEKHGVATRLFHEWAADKSLRKPSGRGTQETASEGEATLQWVTPVVRAPRLQHRTFESAAVKTKVSYFIYTPEAYETDKERRFPVLYWLHGSGGGLPGVPQLVAYFGAAIRAGKVPPMIVVFANGLTNTMWCDSKDGRVPMETVVVKELVPHVDATFRTIASREGRLLEGFSMGGYGAARLGFKHHDLFGTVSILGGGPLQEEFNVNETPRADPRGASLLLKNVYGDDQEYFKAQSPWVLAEQNAGALRRTTRVRQIVGDRDGTLANNRKFDARLTQLKIPHTFTVLNGVGHNPKAVLDALGEANWEFYRAAFSAKGSAADRGHDRADAGAADTPLLTLPMDKRPEWLRRDGIVMAGSWEPLLFRVRRDGAPDYTPTAEQRAAYEREHSPEMVAKLKALGVNFVMMHCFKGGGLEAERGSMADAVKFAKLCRDAGLRVGVYSDSSTLMWDLFFKEVPQAKDWIVLNADGKPITYGNATYRYWRNRNHPDALAYYRNIMRFAVEDIKADLIHLDNYIVGPGHDTNSVARFRQYLRDTFPPALLNENGVADLSAVRPPDPKETNLLARAWADFSCQSIVDAYFAMGRYARSLRPDILMECNPAGVSPLFRWPVDHGRLLRGGEAFWDEGAHPGLVKSRLTTRIRTYKAARLLNNSAFVYVINPLEAAESMAFNLDCLGAICWFEYGEIAEKPGIKKPMSPALEPYVKFFRQRRDLLREALVVADVAVLRSFPTIKFAPPQTAKLTGEVEDLLIANRCAFQLVFDQQLDEISRWPALVMPGCVALSDAQVKAIHRYVTNGGRLCVIGPLATHNEWMLPRNEPALDDLLQDRVVRVDEKGDWLDAIRRACGGQLSLSVTGAVADARLDGLCAELTEQPNRRMVHLVNYRTDNPMKDIAVRVALPKGRSARSVSLASPEHSADITIPFKQEAGFATFTVPAVGVYEIAVVTFK